jgi:L-seryl-tRNA(Ser) seleniumtransferase
VALSPARPDELARELRCGNPAVVGRVADGRLLLDLRSVLPEQDEALAQAVRRALTCRHEGA